MATVKTFLGFFCRQIHLVHQCIWGSHQSTKICQLKTWQEYFVAPRRKRSCYHYIVYQIKQSIFVTLIRLCSTNSRRICSLFTNMEREKERKKEFFCWRWGIHINHKEWKRPWPKFLFPCLTMHVIVFKEPSCVVSNKYSRITILKGYTYYGNTTCLLHDWFLSFYSSSVFSTTLIAVWRNSYFYQILYKEVLYFEFCS